MEFTDSSTITNEGEKPQYSLCFTDNLYLLELNLQNDNDLYLTHPNRPNPTGDTVATLITTFESDGVTTTVPNHTACIDDIFPEIRLLPLPHNLDPLRYGAAAIIRTIDSSTPPYSIGHFFYSQELQRSMYPTLKTKLISTSKV